MKKYNTGGSMDATDSARGVRKHWKDSPPVYERDKDGNLKRTIPRKSETGNPKDHQKLVDQLKTAKESGESDESLQRIARSINESARSVERNRDWYDSQRRGVRLSPRPSEKPYVRGESNKSGGMIKKAKGGSVKSTASKRADGCAVRGKTRGKMV